MSELEWHSPKEVPTLERQCFIEVGNTFQLAYWRDDAQAWDNMTYGWLPKVYDDSGGIYEQEVRRWAYVPEDLFK